MKTQSHKDAEAFSGIEYAGGFPECDREPDNGKATARPLVLESGETVQHALVAIANQLGDNDDSADLAEIVNLLDKSDNEHTALLEALQSIIASLTQPVQYTGIRNGASCDVLRADCRFAVNTAKEAIAKASEVQL